jgi:hypothetical protein
MTTLKIFALLVGLYVLALLPALFIEGYSDSALGILVLIPYLSILLFHKAGVPTMLQHDGLCGWGWCAPTVFGWVLAAVFWLGVIWLLAAIVAAIVAAARASGDATK